MLIILLKIRLITAPTLIFKSMNCRNYCIHSGLGGVEFWFVTEINEFPYYLQIYPNDNE